jgi:hypothetical protein
MPFPSISYPSPTNYNPAPSLELGGDASNAYVAGLHFAQALKAANAQQAIAAQKAADAQALQAAKQQQQYAKMGATLLDGGQRSAASAVPGHTNRLGQTGLQIRPGATGPDATDQSGNRIIEQPGGPALSPEAQDAAQRAVALGGLNQALQSAGQEGIPQAPVPDDLSTHTGHIFTDIRGNRYHVPSQEEAAIAKQAGKPKEHTFIPAGRLADALKEAGVDPSQPISFKDVHSAMQTIGLAAPKPAPKRLVTSPNYETPFVWNPTTGRAEKVEGDVPARTEKPNKYTYRYETDNSGKVNIIRQTAGDEGAPEILSKGQWIPFQGGEAVGARRKEPGAGKGPKQATPSQLDTISRRMKTSLKRAEAKYSQAVKDASIGGYADTEAIAQAQRELRQAKQDAQDTYEDSLSQYGYPVEHVEYSDEPTTKAPTPPAKTAAPATNTPAPPAKSATPPAAPAAPTQKTEAPAQPVAAPPKKTETPPSAQQPKAEAKPLAPWSRLASAPKAVAKTVANAAATTAKKIPQGYVKVRIGNKAGWIDPKEYNPATMQRIP